MIQHIIEKLDKQVSKAEEEYQPHYLKYQKVVKYVQYEKQSVIDRLKTILNKRIHSFYNNEDFKPLYYEEGWFIDTGVILRRDRDSDQPLDKRLTWEEIDNILMQGQ